jgi:type II secretory pathway pseudopilin PulG
MNTTLLSLFKLHKANQGLTLIESLAAIVITTVALGAIAPPLLLSAATRIQSRNAEQAQGIAREELDKIRAALSREEGIPPNGEEGFAPPVSGANPLNSTPGPDTLELVRSNLNYVNEAAVIDADGDGDKDFFVQVMRDQGVRFGSGPASGQLAVFEMGVRVYDITAKDNLGSLNTDQASLGLTNGLNQRGTNPLAVIYTEVSRSDLKLSLDEYREYLQCQQPSPPPSCP